MREVCMHTITISAERAIDAPAAAVYAILADYHRHHPRILPPAISDLAVEQGGIGAGTVIRFTTTLAGSRRSFRQRIEEPEPGRVLREVDIDGEGVTAFTVTPIGETSQVRIETTLPMRGARGIVERVILPRLLRPVYAEELARLDAYAREQVSGSGRSLRP